MFETYYSILLIVFIIPVSFLISYLHYRGTSLSTFRKTTLILLRFLGFSLISILILFPVVRLIEYSFKENKDIVLIDNSLSMKIENRDSILKDKVSFFIQTLENNKRNYDIYLFSGSLIKKINKDDIFNIKYDSIENFKTNLDISIKEILEVEKENKINSINIFSDGIINDGYDLLSLNGVNVKLNFFLIGDTEQKKDLVLKEVLFNKYSYIFAEVPIVVRFSSYKLDKNVKINLYEEDKLIKSEYQNVTQDKSDYEIVFIVKSETEEIKKYKVEIEPDNSEITIKNNYRNFYIKFIPNKFNIMVLSGYPSPDLSFLKNQIQKIGNIKADYFTQKEGTSFYEGNFENLKGYSVVIFFGFPTVETQTVILEKLKKEIEKYGVPIFFFAMRKVDYEKLRYFENYLPFKINKTEATEISIKLKPVKNANVYYPFNFKNIENFPELTYNPSVIKQNPNSEVFLSAFNEVSPVFLISNTETNKSAAFCAYGLNNWRLNPKNVDYEPVFNSILINTISILYDYEKQKLITVTPLKDEFSRFENLILKVKLNPLALESGNIKLRIYNSENEIYPNLVKIDEYNLQSKLILEQKGDYFTEAYIENLDIPEARDYFRFYVNENNFEYNDTRAREDYLYRLSTFTNGVNLTNLNENDLSEIFKSEKQEEISFDYVKNIYLNYNPIYIIVIILLFSIEWFLRKKFNLP